VDVEALCRQFPLYPDSLGVAPRTRLDAVGPRATDNIGKVAP